MRGCARRWRNGKPRPSATAYVWVRYASGIADSHARGTVVVVKLSIGPQPQPPIVVATRSAEDGPVAVCDQIRAVEKVRLTRTVGALSREDLRAVEDGVRAVLQL